MEPSDVMPAAWFSALDQVQLATNGPSKAQRHESAIEGKLGFGGDRTAK